MNATANTPAVSESTNANKTSEQASIVDAVFDAALAWIDVGLGHAKTSLNGSARAMERTAKALETLRGRLRA